MIQRKSAKWPRWLGNLVFLLAMFAAVQMFMKRNTAEGAAPPLSGMVINADTPTAFNLTQEGGKPVLVHFWATWCPVCKVSRGAVESLHGDYHVVTVAMQSGSEQSVLKHVAEAGMRQPVVNDENGSIAAAWGVSGVPTNFIIDGEGNIAFTEIGYTTSVGLRARLWLVGK